MPKRTARLCPRCKRVVKGECPTCAVGWKDRPSKNWSDPRNGTGSKRWRTFRRNYLRKHPLCQWPGCANLATELDHKDGTDYATQRYDSSMVQGLCTEHHRRRTAQQGNAAPRG